MFENSQNIHNNLNVAPSHSTVRSTLCSV